MSVITSVAFGPNDTWVVCEDSDTTWNCGLPTPIYNKLNGRRNNHTCAPTNVAAMGHDGNYVLFFDNYKWWVFCNDLGDELDEDGIRGDEVKTFSFGDNGSYILLLKNGGAYYWGVDFQLQQIIEERNNAGIEWVTIGRNDTYFISFFDGKQYWWSDQLDQVSEAESNSRWIEKVWLSPFDDNYFIIFDDGSTQWVASERFSNGRFSDTWMSPREIYFTNGSISQQFTCGRSIHETAQSLEDGTLAPDDIPCMHVFEYEGCTFSLNNRRLWALSGVDSAPVKFVDPPHRVLSKLRNGFQGASIRLR